MKTDLLPLETDRVGPGYVEGLDDRDAAAAALTQVRSDVLEAGARRLALAAHWAHLHEPAEEPDASRPVHPGMLRPRRAGAHGTPDVAEFASDELSVLLGIHSASGQSLMADATNLEHRHPRLWSRVMACEVVDWIAVKTARAVAAAGLDLEQARWVDAVTAGYAASLTPGRYLCLVDAKIIAADPAAAEKRREAAALERFVRTGQSCEHGLKTLIARATAGEIIYLVAVVDRIAQILALQGDTDALGVRRSKALGILATPARAIQLLAWAEQTVEDEERPTEEPQPTYNDDLDLNAAIAAGLASVDPKKLLPNAVLHLHVSRADLVTGAGVARMEGVGPITVGQVQEFLGHCNVKVKPVLDLEGGMPVDCWEIPAQMREVLSVRQPFEVFPWGTKASRLADMDHTRPYVPPDEGGPPGQTHPDKLGPLGRRPHRLKTHAPGWRHLQLSPGVYLWRTPTGYWTRVDSTGSHSLGRGELGSEISVMEQHFAGLLGVG